MCLAMIVATLLLFDLPGDVYGEWEVEPLIFFVFTMSLFKVWFLDEAKIPDVALSSSNITVNCLNIYSVRFEFIRCHKNSSLLPVGFCVMCSFYLIS